MPRKPAARFLQLKKIPPFAFSPFFRLIARMNFAKKIYRGLDGQSLRGKIHHGIENISISNTLKESIEIFESSDKELSGSEGIVQADFSFFDPNPNDFHGVKILLQSYLDDMEWDLSGFVDLILLQSTVGTVVKIEDDEDGGIYSAVTALSFERYKDSKCFDEIKKFLLKACRIKEIKNDLRLLLNEESRGVCLLVSQRVTNFPLQLLPPLYDALFDEISWATEDEPTEELRMSFNFNFYIIVCRVYKHKNATKTSKKIKTSIVEEELTYIKPEDEIFHKLSTWSFTFPLQKQQPATYELRNYEFMGLVMGVDADKVSEFRHELRCLIGQY